MLPIISFHFRHSCSYAYFATQILIVITSFRFIHEKFLIAADNRYEHLYDASDFLTDSIFFIVAMAIVSFLQTVGKDDGSSIAML